MMRPQRSLILCRARGSCNLAAAFNNPMRVHMRFTVLAITVLLFTGCGSDPIVKAIAAGPPIGMAKCKGADSDSDCKILVNIDVAGAGCRVAVIESQKTVGVKKDSKDKQIWWVIDAAPPGEYRFTDTGIAPKPTTNGWNGNFKNDKLSDDGRAFSWKNKNADPQAGAEYEYEVSVINAAGVTCKQDPIIRNQR